MDGVGLLREALKGAVERSLHGAEKVGIMFSGGVDSAIMTVLAKEFVPSESITLYTAVFSDCKDLPFTKLFVDKFRFRQVEITASNRELKELYVKIKRALKNEGLNCSFMKVELSIPLFLITKKAKEEVDILLNGQGAEELFGGYYEHYKRYREGEDLNALLREELEGLWEKDVRRNSFIARMNKMEDAIRYPYLDPEVIKVALSIPPHRKIVGETRKVVLREVAESMDIPPEIAWRPKKALQYSSGIHKALHRMRRELEQF